MRFRILPIGCLQEIAKFHCRFSSIRQLDADRVFSGNRRENIDPLGASRSGKVSLQMLDAMKFQPNTITGVKPGQQVTVSLQNTGAVVHDFPAFRIMLAIANWFTELGAQPPIAPDIFPQDWFES